MPLTRESVRLPRKWALLSPLRHSPWSLCSILSPRLSLPNRVLMPPTLPSWVILVVLRLPRAVRFRWQLVTVVLSPTRLLCMWVPSGPTLCCEPALCRLCRLVTLCLIMATRLCNESIPGLSGDNCVTALVLRCPRLASRPPTLSRVQSPEFRRLLSLAIRGRLSNRSCSILTRPLARLITNEAALTPPCVLPSPLTRTSCRRLILTTRWLP